MLPVATLTETTYTVLAKMLRIQVDCTKMGNKNYLLVIIVVTMISLCFLVIFTKIYKGKDHLFIIKFCNISHNYMVINSRTSSHLTKIAISRANNNLNSTRILPICLITISSIHSSIRCKTQGQPREQTLLEIDSLL